MKAILLALTCIVFVVSAELAVTSDLIDTVNSQQTFWKAGHNKFSKMDRAEARGLLGVNPALFIQPPKNPFEHTMEAKLSAPASFDARDKWPNCPTINQIRDQAQCGSCWAFAAAEAMSDRLCTYKGINVALSAQDILACAKEYFVISCGSCNGGRPGCAWVSWAENGIVSESCVPYSIFENTTDPTTPSCSKECTGDQTINYKNDKHFGSTHKSTSGEQNYMAELFQNGPIEVAFQVYQDFFSYTSGVYQYTSGDLDGGHAVKIIGYGTDNGVDYWLVANSWGPDWGENGFFRIRRGTNECTIENEAWFGAPK